MNKDITVEELKARMDAGEALMIIDVREPHEYAEYNIGALNIPLGTLPMKIYDFDDDKNREIIVHCRSGSRSNNAKAFLLQSGFTNVKNLLGGMLEWQEKFPGK
ncbi:MAG: rhodanese-like domain-containing protein [Chitinophagales bacterium]